MPRLTALRINGGHPLPWGRYCGSHIPFVFRALDATASPGTDCRLSPQLSMIRAIDVVAKLGGLAATSKERPNWKTSIVDLMKLSGLDSSLVARKQLATELGCPTRQMGDSPQMNVWLHRTVLQKLAANGAHSQKVIIRLGVCPGQDKQGADIFGWGTDASHNRHSGRPERAKPLCKDRKHAVICLQRLQSVEEGPITHR